MAKQLDDQDVMWMQVGGSRDPPPAHPEPMARRWYKVVASCTPPPPRSSVTEAKSCNYSVPAFPNL